MRTFSRTNQFKKDVKRAEKRGKDMAKLKAMLERLIDGEPLPPECRDHRLRGDFAGSRDCHIESDWLLIHALSAAPSGTTQLTLGRKSGSLCAAIIYEFAETHAG